MNITLEHIKNDIVKAVKSALEEDIGSGDITAKLIPAEQISTAEVITREECVVCGQTWFNETFTQLGGIQQIDWHVTDGDRVAANTTLVTLKGNTRNLLTGERTALNFLQLLSGTATAASEYAKLVAGTNIKILDTRKTIPGLRTAQKYAVSVGGCHNHRIGLYDAFLLKENHIKACGGINQAVKKARALYPEKMLEVEVENLCELEEAINSDADVVMLDNFSKAELQSALAIHKKSTKYELSGNLDFDTIQTCIELAVDYMSSGAITKHCKAIDLSFRLTSVV